MLSIERFNTARLVADCLQITDFSELHRLHQDPNVMATLSADGNLRSPEETRQAVHKAIAHWEHHHYGSWMFRNKADGEFVGYCGLKRAVVNSKNEVELLYAVMSHSWRQGLATEMATAVMIIAFDLLGMTDVISYTLPINRASQQVMEKVGFKYECDIVHVNLPHVLYRMTASEWRDKGIEVSTVTSS